MPTPSRTRVIIESIVGAIASVIVAKLVVRTFGGEISSAVLSGIAGGAIAVVFARRAAQRPPTARHVDNLPESAPPKDLPLPSVERQEGSPATGGDASSTGRVS